MKKTLAILVLSSLMPVAALAADDNFTGLGVGAEIETTKYKVSDFKGKQMGGVNLKADYGFNMGDNLVGAVEAKAKVNKTTAFKVDDERLKQADKYSLGYQQGYRVTSDLMPYVKAEYINSKFKDSEGSERAKGFGFGVGTKYNVASNVDVGVEYVHSRLKIKDDSDKLKGNTVSAGVSYRFK